MRFGRRLSSHNLRRCARCESDVSQELARAVATALAKQREDRPASAPAFAARLETIRGSAAIDVGDTESSRQEEGRRQNGESRRLGADGAQVLPGGERRQATIVVAGVSGFAELVDRCAPNEVEEVIGVSNRMPGR